MLNFRGTIVIGATPANKLHVIFKWWLTWFYLFIRIHLGGRNLIYPFSIAAWDWKKIGSNWQPLRLFKIEAFYSLNQRFFVNHVAVVSQILVISRWQVTIQVSWYNICRSFEFMTILSATNRERGGSGHGSGRVRHCVGRVGSGQIIGSWSRVGSGPDPGGSGRVRKIGPGNNSAVTSLGNHLEWMCEAWLA